MLDPMTTGPSAGAAGPPCGDRAGVRVARGRAAAAGRRAETAAHGGDAGAQRATAGPRRQTGRGTGGRARALDLDPRLASAHYVIGAIELDRGHLGPAERAFREVLRQNRLVPGATLQLAGRRWRRGGRAKRWSWRRPGPSLEARLIVARALIADGQTRRPDRAAANRRRSSGVGRGVDPARIAGTLQRRRLSGERPRGARAGAGAGLRGRAPARRAGGDRFQ